MPSLDPEDFRQRVVDDLMYNPPSQSAELYGPTWPAYLERMRDKSSHGDQPEIQAVAAMYDCPIVVLKVPIEPGLLAIDGVCGRDTGGLPIFLLYFNAGEHCAHYCLGIPSDIAAYENERRAARSLVYCTPVSLVVDVSGLSCTMDVFGVPGDGACLFSACVLAITARSVEWQTGGEYCTDEPVLHHCEPGPSSAVETDRMKTVSNIWRRTSGLRSLCSSSLERGAHAFADSCGAQSIKRNHCRDLNGVSLSKPHTVVMDIGSGPLGILLFQSHLNPSAICIGMEQSRPLYDIGVAVHKFALMEGSFDGNIVSCCATVDADTDFDGTTNVDLFDGAPVNSNSAFDPEHVKILAKLMSTRTIDEFCSVKCSSAVAVAMYAECSEMFKKYLPQFQLIGLKGCRQSSKCNYSSMMFVRRKEFRKLRVVLPVELAGQESGFVQSMIRFSQKLMESERNAGPRPLFLFKMEGSTVKCVHKKDCSGSLARSCLGTWTSPARALGKL
jgi:hypothetical protein